MPAEVVEAIYGRAALDDMAAVTAELRRRRDDLRSFVVRARKAVEAIRAAEDRWQAAGRTFPEVGRDETIGVLSGLDELADLASDTGLFDSIIEGGRWCTAPADEEPAPAVVSTKGGQEPQPTNGKVPIERFVDLEGIFGEVVLAEVKAVTAELEALEPTLKPLLERAAGAVKACSNAIDRLRFEAPFEHGDSMWQFLDTLAGSPALNEVALRLGLTDAIWEASWPGVNPVPGQFTPVKYDLSPLLR